MSVKGEYHQPVLLDEVIEYLITISQGMYVDGTLGGGGHAEKILEKIFPHGKLLAIDADEDSHRYAKTRLQRFQSNCIFVHDNSVHLRSIFQTHNVSSIQGLLLDLGVSSYQLDEPSKGFSFRADEKLDMRMDSRSVLDAAIILNTYSEEQLAEIFWEYGEEKFSRRIAKAIIEYRVEKKISTTGELVKIVEKIVFQKFLTKSLARIFQALRIVVNNELLHLQKILEDVVPFLATGARIVVISYHSLEDRIVKNFFSQYSATSIPSGNKLVADTIIEPQLRLLTKKPIVASIEEQEKNPRSRSAKMRVAEKV